MAKLVRVAMVALVLLGTASTVRAEPLVILSGGLALSFEGDGFRFVGKDFSVSTLPNMTGDFGPFYTDGSPAFHCDPCTPGDEFNPSFRTDGEIPLGAGSATFGDTAVSNVSLFGTLDFVATPLPFPSSMSDGIEVRTPFSFNGTVRGLAGNQQVFSVAFIGSGTVSRFLDRLEDGRYVGGEEAIRFAFDSPSSAPVPEPATLVLLASGLGGLLARRRVRKDRADVR